MKLLVVEDEPKTLQAIQQGLEESQFEVDIAYDGSNCQAAGAEE